MAVAFFQMYKYDIPRSICALTYVRINAQSVVVFIVGAVWLSLILFYQVQKYSKSTYYCE